MPKGTISNVVPDRGFGFIKTEEGKELFFHRNELQEAEFSNLKVGQKVEFEIGQDRKQRPQAVKVRISDTAKVEPPPTPVA
jgi:cold shock CspA family protein